MVESPKHDANSPAYECGEYREQLADLETVRDLRAGTRRLRDRAERYLPLEPAEEDRDYKIRLNRAVCFNAYDRAVASMAGLIFRRSPRLEEDVPVEIRGQEPKNGLPEVEGIAERITQDGQHWEVVAKELTDQVIHEGHGFLFVDMPPAPPEGALQSEVELRRPYWVRYRKDQLVNWRKSGGKLVQATFREATTEPDGPFGEKQVVRYRVLRPGSWELWIEQTDPVAKKTSVVQETGPDGQPIQGETPLNEIPVALATSSEAGAFSTTPKLLDLALINLLHYAESSDYRIYLHISSRPVLWTTGYDKPVAHIGPYELFKLKDGGRMEFAETSGAALGSARQDLLDLQEQMAMLSVSMLAAKKPANTATEELLDSVKEESDLMTVARSVKDAIESALRWTAQYLEAARVFDASPARIAQISGGSVDLGSRMEDLVLPPDEMRVYNEMAGRIFSTETIRRMVAKARREVMPEDYSEADEAARLRAEQAAASLAAQELGAAALGAFDRQVAE